MLGWEGCGCPGRAGRRDRTMVGGEPRRRWVSLSSGTKPGPGCLASILSLWGSLLTVAVVWSLSPIRQEAALVFAQS